MSAADEMRKLHALSTAKRPKLRTPEIVEPLVDLHHALAEAPVEDRQRIVRDHAPLERLASALLVWRFTPCKLELPEDDPLIQDDRAGDAAFAMVRFGEQRVHESFLRDVLANAGHPGVMRLFYPLVEVAIDPKVVIAALKTLSTDGNELHLFNALHFLSEAAFRGYPYIPFELLRGAQKAAAKSKLSLVRAAAER